MKIILLLIIFQMFGCDQDSYVEYKSPEGYSFNYDNNYWELKEDQAQAFLFIREDLEQKKRFRTNINFIIQDLSKTPLTLEQYHNTTLGQIEQVLGKDAIISEQEIKISSINAIELVYTMSNQKKESLKLKQVYFIKNNKAYLITYTSEMRDYDKHLSKAEKVFSSFTVN